MQIDFHHATTYVLARWAGFPHKEADIIAYCAQYVDDATNMGWVVFDNGAMYYRTASAHQTHDVAHNFSRQGDAHAWVPFHFLPGNGFGVSGPPLPMRERLVCRAGSAVADEMFRACILDKDTPFGGPHRLGITAHVYADTFAHHDFSGLVGPVNGLIAVSCVSPIIPLDNIFRFLVGLIPNLGHADARIYPDLPFLTWTYTKSGKPPVTRSNPTLFLTASQALYGWFTRYRAGDPEAPAGRLNTNQQDYLTHKFTTLTDPDGEDRHASWLSDIQSGLVPGVDAEPSLAYAAKGPGSWKTQATELADKLDKPGAIAAYSPAFLTSDWKRFHDLLQYHRLYVLNLLLPKFGICAG